MRPDKDTYFLRHATIAAQMSTCKRRSVGCVLINARRQILAVGFNGVPSGMPHCNEGHPCPGADSPSGTNLSKCFATHAEVNAVIQCRDPYSIDTVYTTTSPCVDCTKFLMNTSAQRIVFIEAYPHEESKRLWESVGRTWDQATAAAEEIDHGPFRKHCDCFASHGQHLSGNLVVCDSCGLPPSPKVDLLRAAREACRGGGYVGRMKAGIIDAQIKRATPDPNCQICKGTGKIAIGWCMGHEDEEWACSCVK